MNGETMTREERALYDLFCALDNQDTPLEEWPARAIAALSAQGAAPPAQAAFARIANTLAAEQVPLDADIEAATSDNIEAMLEGEQADTKQAEPLRVTRNRLYKAWNAMERASNAYEMLAVLHQLGAKVEVSDG